MHDDYCAARQGRLTSERGRGGGWLRGCAIVVRQRKGSLVRCAASAVITMGTESDVAQAGSREGYLVTACMN